MNCYLGKRKPPGDEGLSSYIEGAALHIAVGVIDVTQPNAYYGVFGTRLKGGYRRSPSLRRKPDERRSSRNRSGSLLTQRRVISPVPLLNLLQFHFPIIAIECQRLIWWLAPGFKTRLPRQRSIYQDSTSQHMLMRRAMSHSLIPAGEDLPLLLLRTIGPWIASPDRSFAFCNISHAVRVSVSPAREHLSNGSMYRISSGLMLRGNHGVVGHTNDYLTQHIHKTPLLGSSPVVQSRQTFFMYNTLARTCRT